MGDPMIRINHAGSNEFIEDITDKYLKDKRNDRNLPWPLSERVCDFITILIGII